MAAVLNSRLNPLANDFIPSGLQESKHLFPSENKLKTTRKWSAKCIVGDFEIKNMEHTDMEINLYGFQEDYFRNETIYSFNEFKNTTFVEQYRARKDKDSYLCNLPKWTRDQDKGLVQKYSSESTNTSEAPSKGKNADYNYLSMFGWDTSQNISGHPFNLGYDYYKKFPKNSSSMERSDIYFKNKYDSSDVKSNELTLLEYHGQVYDILKDIYDIVGRYINTEGTKHPDPKPVRPETCDVGYPEMPSSETNDLYDESKSYNSSETALELVDDGFHPLLHPTNLDTKDDGKELVGKVEKILERSLMRSSLSGAVDYFDSGTVCETPCSIWCEFLPSAAKDTFKKYIQKSKNKGFKETGQQKVPAKPIFKRSFSADDAPELARISGYCRQTSSVGSRDKLLLLRKDPLSYFKNNAPDALKAKEEISYDFTESQFANLKTGLSSMWEHYDSADSLWQPLPECIPVNEYNSKQNCYKRGREMRRQRSMN